MKLALNPKPAPLGRVYWAGWVVKYQENAIWGKLENSQDLESLGRKGFWGHPATGLQAPGISEVGFTPSTLKPAPKTLNP